MESNTSLSVGEVARIAHVTVRTLHHYDEIGLLTPSARSDAGYRLYSEADLERLQQIFYYRQLGFSLDEVAVVLDEAIDGAEHLRRQHGLLRERIEKLELMMVAVEHEMEVRRMGISLTPEERFEVFGDFDPQDYQDEVEERWGQTDAYKESRRRTSTYTKDDWVRIKAEWQAITERFADAVSRGEASAGPAALALAEEHRAHITRWYYDCSYEIHTGLAQMYVGDPRFKANYDDIRPGLAQFVYDAILANADQHSS